jgi:hypothetical protein
VGTLNRHSRCFGIDPLKTTGKRLRGQRVFCSNRGQRGGCGRTFCLVFAEVFPRHTFPASLLWPLWVGLLDGTSLQAAAESLRLPFALETVYHWRRKLRRQVDRLRVLLCGLCPPAASAQADPWLQTVEHLRQVFPRSGCPPAEFQLHFQQPFVASLPG